MSRASTSLPPNWWQNDWRCSMSCCLGPRALPCSSIRAMWQQPSQPCGTSPSSAARSYRVPEILTLGRFPDARESDSTWRTQEVRHVGSDTIAPRFWCVPAAWFGEEDERRTSGPSASGARRNYDGATRSEAAMIGGVGLQIIRDWVLHFDERGPDGFTLDSSVL